MSPIRPSGIALALALALVAGVAAPSKAQTSIRDILIVDSLSPVKMQLRDDVAGLRDTLTLVEAMHARIVRANASGMNSVVQSGGRQLGRRCHASAAMADLTTQRVSVMKTSDVRGEQALASFRTGLATLSARMRLCQRDDSALMAGPAPDRQRIQQLSTAASDAIAEFDQVRDALLRLLDINLPVKR
ncbi:MAG: hypothetical protein ACRELE_01860 [Gemmatimonadales bacterium]